MAEDYAVIESRDNVALVTLNSPDVLNAFTHDQMDQLVQALKELDSDRSIRVLIITGAGRGFCAGVNLMVGTPGKPRDDEHLYTMNAKALAWWMLEIYQLEKPIIAAINGPAAGAGFSLAMTCDIRLASEDAKFVAAWVDRGISPDAGSTHHLPRMLGPSIANELAMTATPMDPQRALQTGLVSHVYKTEDLLPAAWEMAQIIADKAPIAVMHTKKSIRLGMQTDMEKQIWLETGFQALLQRTNDFQEGMTAFRERRKPKFEGL